MYGERARIGLITLATDTGVMPEYQRLMPSGVQVYPSPILLPRGDVTPAALTEMLADDSLERAATLLSWARVDVIVFACTTGSLVNGRGWDQELIARIRTASDIPATTTATAVLEMMRNVGSERLAIATPYLPELNTIERAFFEDHGFDVVDIAGLGCATDPEIGRLGPADAVALLETMETEQADTIFISCTNWHVVESIAAIARRYGKNVTTSNLAGAWLALSLAGLERSAKDLQSLARDVST